MARDLHMSVTAMAPANRGSFSGRVSQLSLLMRAGISRQPSATSLHQLHACRDTRGVQGYTVGMRPLKRETGPELRFRTSDTVSRVELRGFEPLTFSLRRGADAGEPRPSALIMLHS